MPELKDIMGRKVVTVAADTPVSEVAQIMSKGRFGSVLVMDGSWLVGIFTERDVVRAAGSGTDLTSSPISKWMTRDPITVTPETDTDQAAEIMLSHGFRHLPVLEEKNVVGIVSLRDLLSVRVRRPTT